MDSKSKERDIRQKALQQELGELVDVVGPGPLVDLLLERAFQLNATDVHFDPDENGIRIRLRVDGLLHAILHVPAAQAAHMISRIKLMGGMDITEKRLPQDGHISNLVMGTQRDIRVACGPTNYGERVVMRLMPGEQAFHRLDDLGFDDAQLPMLKRFLNIPYGMILTVGPVGAGKSTTMYGCLDELNDPSKSICTIEDPVERRMDGINQTQINTQIDFTFARALRMLLRQDPDVLMIGEIRDPETAQIGSRAGLAGTLVLSTLHANDTTSTFDVLRGFNVPPMVIADSVYCVVTQRLLRKICQNCKVAYQPDEPQCEILGLDPAAAGTVEIFKGTGCDTCFGTGYLGRTAVFEVLGMDADLRRAVLHHKPRLDILQIAKEKGMETLEMAASRKVIAGQTSYEEMNRVLSAFPGE
ncbi:putative type II secretion system protein E [Symmachiella macrocystis]|uniref:Putative type II secretion system protein E n=1 Tax=Symmachiella macrocystis TaxID=2527985 RepID=A0A5C6BH57_9PLAN|nr:GspE/PulE family protein [Symmachiella macrocystis]TWU11483.1 putative type II secretion system protein E [Symmachiella macrocystis]